MPVRTHGGACNWYLYIIKLRHRYYPEIATTKVLPDRQHLWAFLPAEPFECLEQQYVSWRGWWPGRARHKVDRVRILVDQGLPKPTRPSVWPCALLIVIANARRNGNWVLRKSKGRSAEEDGAKGIRGMKTIMRGLIVGNPGYVAWKLFPHCDWRMFPKEEYKALVQYR